MLLKQFFIQREGKGILELVGTDNYDSALLFHGTPVSLNWNDMGGSIFQYLTRRQDKNWDHDLVEIRGRLDNYGPTRDYAKSLKVLVDLFTNGYYLFEWIRYFPLDFMPFFMSFTLDCGQCRKFYPEMGINSYLLSRSEDKFNQDTIDRYKRLIIEGKHPLIISAQPINSEVRYIVDGNHKAKAYQQLGGSRRPLGEFAILNITRLDPPEIQLEMATEYIATGTSAYDNYKENKQSIINYRLR